MRSLHGMSMLGLLSLVITSGCGQQTPPAAVNDQSSEAKSVTKSEESESKDTHSEWWCPEHGVPEAECAQCSAKVAAEFKKKDDWCEKHDRPDSQCFVCHPELKEKFAARYVAKYGKQPPPIEEESKSDKQEEE